MKHDLDNQDYTNTNNRSAFKALSSLDIKPTSQRIDIANIIFCKDQHLSAEDIIVALNKNGSTISRATVYNTLNLFAQKGLVQRVVIDSSKVYYDSKTTQHSHYYNIDTGEISDFEFENVKISPLPELPENTLQDGIDIVVRIKSSKKN
jgi:Fur family iron response transcriptional regulator